MSRVYPNKYGLLRLPAEGGHGQDLRGRWWLRLPGQNARTLSSAEVTLNANGTITVSGFLINGDWWRLP